MCADFESYINSQCFIMNMDQFKLKKKEKKKRKPLKDYC